MKVQVVPPLVVTQAPSWQPLALERREEPPLLLLGVIDCTCA